MESSDFHTFSYGCLLFIYRYLLDFLEVNISYFLVFSTIVRLLLLISAFAEEKRAARVAELMRAYVRFLPIVDSFSKRESNAILKL